MRQLPNIITLTRIVGAAFIFFLTPFSGANDQGLAVLLYIVIAASDALDGYLARRYGWESDFGKIMDPLADKILVLVLLAVIQMGEIHPFPVFIILTREFLVMGLRTVAASKGVVIAADWSGKLKTILTLPLCAILLARVPMPGSVTGPLSFMNPAFDLLQSVPETVIASYITLVVVITIWSLVSYVNGYVKDGT